MEKKIISDFDGQAGISQPIDYFFYEKCGIPIFDINTFHLLTQFVGYAKYINRNNGNVYLRGQSSLYEKKCYEMCGSYEMRLLDANLIPSTFRRDYASISRALSQLGYEIGRMLTNHKTLCDMDPLIKLPLLQHYGIKTNWLDVVDNIWVALWFGLHNFSSIIVDRRELMHVSQRHEGKIYLLLLLSDAATESIPGIYNGSFTILNDLRKSLPSYYLRPHAQHALMLRKKNANETVDYSDLIVGIATVSVATALDWIGRSGLLSVQSLFPSAFFDLGYRDLLEYVKIPSGVPTNYIDVYGSIHNITNDFF